MLRTKIIVITGYVLLVALSIIGIVWIYLEWLNYMKGATSYPQRQKELVALNNTLATLYQAEGTIGLFTETSGLPLTQAYDSLMTASFDHIHHLKQISNDSILIASLDSLGILLLLKKDNIAERIRLMQSFATDTVKLMTQKTVLSQYDMNALDNVLNNTLQQEQDTSIIVGERKGIIRRIGDAIRTSNPDTILQIHSYSVVTQYELDLPILTDTIVKTIQEFSHVAQKRNAAITIRMLKQQNELHAINEQTTAHINRIMNELETKYYNDNLKLSNERTEATRRSSVVVSIIAIVAILTAIIFMSWILHSLTVSQRLHRQIEEAKKHVEQLLASREQLMLTITHDIKAPVSSILGYLELMMKDKPLLPSVSYVKNMQHSATHILNLVRNLLDFHSLEINGQKPEQLEFSPFILLSDIYQSFVPDAKKKELQFDFHPEVDENAQYRSDPYRIRQIINNILSNAIKYTPAQGRVVFSASLLQNPLQSTELAVVVQDTGPGIHEDDRQHIFEAFKRLDYTGSDIEGLGLGLNISNKMAQLLGGSITVDSTVGKGSVFTLTLPLYPIPVSIAPPVKEQPVNILFIDDDAVQLDLVSRITEREGMIPHTCSKGSEVLQLLQKKRFDIIFSDIQMPDMTGFELVKRIREAGFEGAKTIPIIGLSANSQVSQAEYEAVGFSAFLVKPFTSDQLIQTIHQYAGKETDPRPVVPEKIQGFEALVEFAGGNGEARQRILWSFITENRKNYQTLVQAFADCDWETIRNVSHKMLPLMKMISAEPLTSLLEKYEAGAQDKENQTLFLDLIKDCIQQAAQFINKHIK